MKLKKTKVEKVVGIELSANELADALNENEGSQFLYFSIAGEEFEVMFGYDQDSIEVLPSGKFLITFQNEVE